MVVVVVVVEVVDLLAKPGIRSSRGYIFSARKRNEIHIGLK